PGSCFRLAPSSASPSDVETNVFRFRVEPHLRPDKTKAATPTPDAMKTILLTLFVSACAGSAVDLIRCAERLPDAVFCYVDEGERLCNIYTRDPGGFTARITLPGAA